MEDEANCRMESVSPRCGLTAADLAIVRHSVTVMRRSYKWYLSWRLGYDPCCVNMISDQSQDGILLILSLI